MRIITILFTYNRPWHTNKTLEALKKNSLKPEELWIFQDGPKNENDKNWYEVGELIRNVDWCVNRVIVSDKNQGLGKSIVNGINKAFEEADAVIVLEDDCVTHPMFLDFMYDALNKYRLEKKVFQINANAYPVDLEQNGIDAFFTPRVDCWGWGTWKDRWQYMSLDYSILKRIKENEHTRYLLENYGKDLEGYMINTLYSKSNSWACFWGMTVFEQDGLCLSVYESLVENIGFDSSGTNSKEETVYIQKLRDANNCSKLVLPEIIAENEEIKDYLKEYSAWTAKEEKLEIYNKALSKLALLYQGNKNIYASLCENGIKTIAIFGKGIISDIIINELKDYSIIKNIIVSRITKDKADYHGIEVVGLNDVKQYDLIIVIPEYDIEFIKKKIDCDLIIGINDFLDNLV